MKELSVEEKAKRYDEAIKYAHYLINERCKKGTNGSFHRADLERMFPELAESEDEKIKKVIYGWICTQPSQFFDNGFSKEEMLAWLEKQGEQKPIACSDGTVDNSLEGIINAAIYWGKEAPTENGIIPENKVKGAVDYYCSLIRNNDGWSDNGEQKPADEVEPKFHKGEWITNGDYTWKIVEVKPLDYILQSQDGNVVDDTISHVDEQFHSFTIEDAKDGDVLYSKSDCGIEYIVMSKGVNNHNNIDSYFRYNSVNGFGIDIPDVLSAKQDNITPATKEQRDLLEKAMSDAGYAFNFEKKEFKKIEQNPAEEYNITGIGSKKAQGKLGEMIKKLKG